MDVEQEDSNQGSATSAGLRSAASAPESFTLAPRREKLISHALSRVLRHEAHRHDLPMNTQVTCPCWT